MKLLLSSELSPNTQCVTADVLLAKRKWIRSEGHEGEGWVEPLRGWLGSGQSWEQGEDHLSRSQGHVGELKRWKWSRRTSLARGHRSAHHCPVTVRCTLAKFNGTTSSPPPFISIG